MIVKRNLSPPKVLRYVRAPLAYATAMAVAVGLGHALTGGRFIALPFAPIGTLGAAVADIDVGRFDAIVIAGGQGPMSTFETATGLHRTFADGLPPGP